MSKDDIGLLVTIIAACFGIVLAAISLMISTIGVVLAVLALL